MRVECPHCHAVFEVPEALAKGVKRLRCANCGDSWEVTSPAVTTEAAPDAGAAEPAVFEVEVPEEAEDLSSAKAEPPVFRNEAQGPAIGSMASRNSARRSPVLHSRSAGDIRTRTDTPGPSMIGSTGAWIAAWGASLVVAGSGIAALWYCRGAGIFGFLHGVGHPS